MSFEVVAPTSGGVSLELDWREAEVLTRLVGMCNSGDLRTHAPVLHDFVTKMVEEVGRNTPAEADNYLVKVGMGQLWLEEV